MLKELLANKSAVKNCSNKSSDDYESIFDALAIYFYTSVFSRNGMSASVTDTKRLK